MSDGLIEEQTYYGPGINTGLTPGGLVFIADDGSFETMPHLYKHGDMVNIGFSHSGGVFTVCQADGSAFDDSEGNRGYIWIRSYASGKIVRGKVVSNISIDLGNSHWALDGLGNINNIFLRVYAINDGSTEHDFTPTWGLGLQGGFYYIRSSQAIIVSANVDQPEEILTNALVSNDFSSVFDAGFISANFSDAANTWSINNTQPGVSADGLWMNYGDPGFTGFSSDPTSLIVRWMMEKQTVNYQYVFANPGTSNATGYTMTAPIKANFQYFEGVGSYGFDNGVALTTPVLVNTQGGTNILDLYSDFSGAAWTAANDKAATVKISYEAYQP